MSGMSLEQAATIIESARRELRGAGGDYAMAITKIETAKGLIDQVGASGYSMGRMPSTLMLFSEIARMHDDQRARILQLEFGLGELL